MPPAITQTLTVRIYYEDTDFSGRVYHASYLRFLERGRTEFLRALGFSNAALAAEDGVVFAVRSLTIDYRAPALMDDLLRIETRIGEIGGASLTFVQRACRDDVELVSAAVRVAILRDGRPARLPPILRRALSEAEPQGRGSIARSKRDARESMRSPRRSSSS